MKKERWCKIKTCLVDSSSKNEPEVYFSSSVLVTEIDLFEIAMESLSAL